MNKQKANKKLLRLEVKADDCRSRDDAQKIIKKADKVYEKLSA
tara:strand:+ start:241 stop:369 length:129 start_codon:yes stop_codon:yes gene_type:complete